VQVIAAPVPQLAGEGAAENNLAGNVASVKAGQIPSKRQLAGEGAAANSILSSTDNGIGYGTENAEVNLAGDVTAVKAGQIPKRQLDKVAKGAQTLSNAAGTGASTSSLTGAAVSIDGSSTSGAANLGADAGALEQSTLEAAGSGVPKTRRQADKICKGAQVLSTAAGTGALTNNPVNSCVGMMVLLRVGLPTLARRWVLRSRVLWRMLGVLCRSCRGVMCFLRGVGGK